MRQIEYVDQPFGLGDICFLYPMIAHLKKNFWGNEHSVIWPIQDQFLWLREYVDTKRDQVHLVREDQKPVGDNVHWIPFQQADHIVPIDCMSAKYALYNVDINIWKSLPEYINWDRSKGEKLYCELGLDKTDYFAVVNKHFANPSLGYQTSFEPKFTKEYEHIVYQTYVPGYSLLDWLFIYEVASEIHTVSTANFYLLSTFYTEAVEQGGLHLYPRKPLDNDLSPIMPIIDQTRWTLHQ